MRPESFGAIFLALDYTQRVDGAHCLPSVAYVLAKIVAAAPRRSAAATNATSLLPAIGVRHDQFAW